MAFFPRNFYNSNSGSETSFTPLFRLLDDFDTYSRQGQSQQRGTIAFQPKFDVREVDDAYELHGELAGLNKKDVSIEFTDPHTLHIRGRVQRSYTAGTPPKGLLEDASASGALTEGSDKHEQPASGRSSPKFHKPTVEDETDGADSTAVPTPASTVAEVSKPAAEEASTPKARGPRDTAKYWVTERSIGEFSRTFNFPGQILQDAVTASLNDGILTIRVPKAPKHEARRININ
ncbi:hypothetical protein VD0004_g6449 [Verticillium dahliae]|uniref:SHSP domain-containing protein n=1 Tax=Verticillium dahliae TaxID=27337 RepID=A0A444RYL3_VERDA|nr:hypothetical protein VD0004_g6449 [Verticillium dahliae]PNH71119.1 hypothetical protein VD0001_g6420 [Verticillium dahliae]RXG46199.1 hypothetical protein VDGE_08797 [Verticillium dahliae]